jgi:hypothetical protein
MKQIELTSLLSLLVLALQTGAVVAQGGPTFLGPVWHPGEYIWVGPAYSLGSVGLEFVNLEGDIVGFVPSENGNWMEDLEWSPDGRKLAGASDGEITVYSYPELVVIARIRTDDRYSACTQLAWNRTATQIAAVCSSPKSVVIYDVTTGFKVNYLALLEDQYIGSIGWYPEESSLYFVADYNWINKWHTDSGLVERIDVPYEFSGIGRWFADDVRVALVLPGYSGLGVYDFIDDSYATSDERNNGADALFWSRDGKYIVSLTNGFLSIHDAETLALLLKEAVDDVAQSQVPQNPICPMGHLAGLLSKNSSVDDRFITVRTTCYYGIIPIGELVAEIESGVRAIPTEEDRSMEVSITQTQEAISMIQANLDWIPVEKDFGLPGGGIVTMVRVPAGCFMMGSDDPYDERLVSVFEVCFDEPFWIDKYEVTNGQYGTVGCRSWSSEPDQPRVCVSWLEAHDYCEARNARLPTEAEWEYAARGPDSWVYPWGNDYDETSIVPSEQIASVGSRQTDASWVGARDMAGNVSEWTHSLYENYPYDALDGREDETRDRRLFYCIVRGGAIFMPANRSSADRMVSICGDSDNYSLGFRCARDER